MKILISHPTGNANVRYLLDGFKKKQIPFEFHTSIATYPNNLFGMLSMVPVFKEFQRRAFEIALKANTINHPYKELGRIIALKLGIRSLLQHEEGLFCIDKVYDYIDRKIADTIIYNNYKAIYAYEDAAINSFIKARSLGITCLYDLPIGYWRAARELLEVERQNRPDWANTLTGFKDSNQKLERKDRELSLADHIFVASSFTAETLKYYHGVLAPISVIPYGFSSVCTNRVYTPTRGRQLKLLFVGGLSQRKGIANVLEAVKIIGDSVSLTIVGHKSVNDCKPLNDGLSKHTWIPSLPHNEILRLMKEHDLLLFPSLFEGFGLVITEAMAQGTPVITTHRTAGGDFIKHGKNGWLVEPGSTESLIAIISELLNQPETIIKVSLAARQTASERSWENYSEQMLSKIEELKIN